MGKQIEKLTALEVKALAKPGRYADGGSLYVTVSPTGSKSWSFIYRHGGRQREAGLGSLDAFTLKGAREIAAQGRAMLKEKPARDPLSVWQAAKRTQSVLTFEQAAEVFLAKKIGDETVDSAHGEKKADGKKAGDEKKAGGEWRSDKIKRQARMMLATYCKPIAKRRIDEIDTRDVLKVLQPLFARAPAVGGRLRGYIENTLNAARALGDIDAHRANPARWRGHLDALLPKRPEGEHFAALDYRRAPAFIAELRRRRFNEDGSICIAAFALEFCILTATRASEALGCVWQEIDGDVWTIPKERMKKADRPHAVPLSDAAVQIVEAMRAIRVEGCAFTFPGRFKYRPMSSKTFERLLASMEEAVTTHGFRSSFRDFAGNETPVARDVCEMALSHKVGDQTERAYRRDDAFEKRRVLMELWAAFISAPPAEPKSKPDNVVTFKKREHA